MTTSLILGGARSGKSAHAQRLAEASAPVRVYIATAEARDHEMEARIEKHRAARGDGWRTVEAPLDLSRNLRGDAEDAVVLVDCLTLWLCNLLEAGRDVATETEALIETLRARRGDAFLVSNEIGLGLVPETPLGRAFRDAQGLLNQRIAAAADIVEFVAAGLPLRLKG